ncbi:flagellar biosynthetic protein FliR [Sulfuritalea sp.]|uniref:flagellar biosynthetic protein FliR n=1 Tax=Sulfuritalea sp. TaxID=2480090 RepID=UPI001AC69E7C|nr:flagellar biosynthetic protein FliR [Sulfuritalea sp.]MBN8474856.1 flagellar biosynthetic protein FliR [Sulfuritalea sp.]
MISISSAQLDAWLGLFVFPLTRVLGLLAMTPVFNNAALPVRVRLVMGLGITFALAPALPPTPAIEAGSWLGLAVIAEQMLIGVMMGFALRIALAALDVTGELIGLQMGLSFATFFDPTSSSVTPVMTQFLGFLTALMFLSMNGHLLALTLLAESFTLLPVSTTPFHAVALWSIVTSAAMMFSLGVMLALPLITALLVTNIALGVLSRVAPALNLFAVGFPVTLALGFVVLWLTLPYIGAAMESVFNRGFELLELSVRAAAAG